MTKGIIYGVREHVQESLDGAAALIRNPPARPTIGKMASFVGRMAGKVYAGHESLGFELVLEKDKISEHVGLNALLRYTLGLREMEIFYLDNPISHSRLTSIEYGGNVYSPGASTEAIREEERKSNLYAESPMYYGIREARKRSLGDYRVDRLRSILQEMYLEEEEDRLNSVHAGIMHASRQSNPWAYFLKAQTAEKIKKGMEKEGFSVSIL